MTDAPATPAPLDEDRITALSARLRSFERSAHRQRIIISTLTLALVIAVSGWWLTSRDQSATRRNGAVADCRAEELAVTLDAFRVIVAPGSTDRATAKAARDLEAEGPLVDRYDACDDNPDPGGP